jgi:7-carboxy-7-deazaguanine synthase
MRICEIFKSIQGESSCAGMPCVFVRLTGCNLRCSYCDTTYAYEEGAEMSVDEVCEAVEKYATELVEVTGGEPLEQADTALLIRRLLDSGHTVLVETNGSKDISVVDRRAIIIMDIKSPGSGMFRSMDLGNLRRLRPSDELKFVVADRAEYEWAKAFIADNGLAGKCLLNLSPAFGVLAPRRLAEWIIEDGLKVRLNMQLHKYIFNPDERGV